MIEPESAWDEIPASETCRRSPFAEFLFTGGVLGHVFDKDIAPQGLKRTAAAVKRIHLGEFRVIAAHVAPLDAMGGDTGIILLFCASVSHVD
jgi:hypothetical protein